MLFRVVAFIWAIGLISSKVYVVFRLSRVINDCEFNKPYVVAKFKDWVIV
jgi:hypothetical protein